MVLQIQGIKNKLFKHSNAFDIGLGKVRIGMATFVVAVDGSGDFDSIQEAINALPSTGGSIHIKEGTYKITSTISIAKNDIYLFGNGKGTILENQGLNAGNPFIDINNPRVKLERLWIKGTSTGVQSINIDITGNDVKIRNCWITDATDTGIGINGNYIEISGNIIDSNKYGIEAGGNNNIITKNHIINNSEFGIFATEIIKSIITGNNVSTNTKHGIVISAEFNPSNNNIISNNICDGNDTGATGNYSGIEVSGSDNNIISNNRCIGNGKYGINIFNNTCDKNIIIGNICLGNTTGAINDAGTNTHPNGASGTTNLALDDLNIIA
ncbi:hypothetical protein LCGC14_1204280 [marine sediment metagenome]|uniref:Right handed beta helix domain-containing protein n=1 Tax=marine sediment metagenome TaxID=412755 RepID=A0A0F9LKC8_9ZZZZ